MDYGKHEEYFIVNKDDNDLHPIRVDLPSPPPPEQIAGYGLKPSKQKWRVPETPEKLVKLQKSCNTVEEVWDKIDNNRVEYIDEMAWIRKQWYHRLYGYWFYNNGIPTYIDGWHYFFLAFWHIDIGLPKYRSRDRKFFLFARYCYEDTKGFKNRDEDGYAIPEDDGTYAMLETNSRVSYGFIYPKHRREGATYKADCIMFEMVSRTENAWGGIQSMTENAANKAFIKAVIAPWKKLPFFFLPKCESGTDPKNVLSFNPPGKMGKSGTSVNIEVGLNSRINFATAHRGSYDGDKLLFHHGDEEGKTKEENVADRWRVVRQCLSQGGGANITGFTIKTSTVGEMEKQGGENFKAICDGSHWQRRSKTGRTPSGLYILFIPAYDGLEGFIDEYGNSIIDTPTRQQAKFIGKNIGAKEYITEERKMLEDNPAAWAEYVRQHPIRYKECFLTSATESGFNIRKIIERVNVLDMNPQTQRGNFKWVNGIDTRVEFIEDPAGRFVVSKLLRPEESNKKIYKDDTYYPQDLNRFTASADPFSFNKTKGNRKSDGAGAVFWNRDTQIDPDDKDLSEWSSYRFVCTYSQRVEDRDEYCEDMIMMCVYYGAMMYPEVNVPVIWDYFEKRKYSGYLKYDVDHRTMKQSKTPGFNSLGGSKQKIFQEWMQYIAMHCDRERHDEILKECRDISGIEDMTNYDLFTAGGGCLLARSNTIYEEEVGKQMGQGSIDDYIDTWEY